MLEIASSYRQGIYHHFETKFGVKMFYGSNDKTFKSWKVTYHLTDMVNWFWP